MGEITGVQALVAGTVTPLGDTLRLSVKVLDSETAQIISGISADMPRNKATDELLAKGVSTDLQRGAEGATGDTAPNSPMTQVESGVRIELKRCERRSSREVVCLFTAESLKKDVVFGMVTCNRTVVPNSMVDGKGNFQEAEWFAIGSAQGHDLCDHVTTTLVQSVPVEGQAAFGGVAPEVDRIALLTLVFGFDNGDNFTLKFRNIALRTP